MVTIAKPGLPKVLEKGKKWVMTWLFEPSRRKLESKPRKPGRAYTFPWHPDRPEMKRKVNSPICERAISPVGKPRLKLIKYQIFPNFAQLFKLCEDSASRSAQFYANSCSTLQEHGIRMFSHRSENESPHKPIA